MGDKQKIIDFWLWHVQDSLDLADSLFQSKKYHYCLFFCQLVLEHRLKAEVVETTDDAAPYSHDLVKLAKITKIPFSETDFISLQTISQFNLDARYDNYKLKFYKLSTLEFTSKWLNKTKEILEWINTHSILKSNNQ